MHSAFSFIIITAQATSTIRSSDFAKTWPDLNLHGISHHCPQSLSFFFRQLEYSRGILDWEGWRSDGLRTIDLSHRL